MYSSVRYIFIQEKKILKYDKRKNLVFGFKLYSLVVRVKDNNFLFFIFKVILETGKMFSLKLRIRNWLPNS